MPEDFTGSRFFDVLLWLASVFGAVGVIGGVVWWLIWPRVEDKLQEVIRGVAGVEQQLTDTDRPDSVGRHAKVAASAAAELPAIRERLTTVDEQLGSVSAGLAEVDRWRGAWEVRLASIEQIVLALLGPELRRRLSDLHDLPDPDDPPPRRPHGYHDHHP